MAKPNSYGKHLLKNGLWLYNYHIFCEKSKNIASAGNLQQQFLENQLSLKLDFFHGSSETRKHLQLNEVLVPLSCCWFPYNCYQFVPTIYVQIQFYNFNLTKLFSEILFFSIHYHEFIFTHSDLRIRKYS